MRKLALCVLDQGMVGRVPEIVAAKAEILDRQRIKAAPGGHLGREVGVIRNARHAHFLRVDIEPLVRERTSLDDEVDPDVIAIAQRTACCQDLGGRLRGHHLDHLGQRRAHQELATFHRIALAAHVLDLNCGDLQIVPGDPTGTGTGDDPAASAHHVLTSFRRVVRRQAADK